MKARLLEQIREELRGQLLRLSKAAQEAHAAATDPGSKAESKYDTRNLEASYLATGQARQVDELATSVRIFDALELPNFPVGAGIDVGALVEVSLRGNALYFLLAPTAGGLEILHEGQEITVLTPSSELYGKFLGLRAGDTIEQPPMRVVKVC